MSVMEVNVSREYITYLGLHVDMLGLHGVMIFTFDVGPARSYLAC